MIVVLDNIRSIHNVGSIFRTADALDIQKIYCCGITPTPLDRFGKFEKMFSKIALGAERTIPWEHKKSALQLTGALKKKGYTIFAIEQSKKSVPYFRIHPNKKELTRVALVLGSEVKGISKSVLKASDKILEIPMGGHKESLNVAVSFGIVGFHLKYPR